MEGIAKTYKQHEKIFRTFYLHNKENVLLARYEDLVTDLHQIFVLIEDFLEMKIPKNKQDFIETNYSMSQNLKRASHFEEFEQFDSKSYIHGNHINNGTPGA